MPHRYVAPLLGLAIAILPSQAFPQALGPMLCAIVANNIGVLSAVASIGVILLGIGATLGKVTWPQALLVLVGISIMFGFVVIINIMVAPFFAGNASAALAARCPGW